MMCNFSQNQSKNAFRVGRRQFNYSLGYVLLFCFFIPNNKPKIPLKALGLRQTTTFIKTNPFRQNRQKLKPQTVTTAAITNTANL